MSANSRWDLIQGFKG